MRIVCLSFIFSLGAVVSQGQALELTLEQCQQLARSNHPIVGQLDWFDQSNQLLINNLNKNYLPRLTFNAQATWQTEVTQLPVELPFPGLDIPAISRDQYRTTLELRQSLWDGGLTAREKTLRNAATHLDKQRVEVDLYSLREQVVALFFNILLLDEQLLLNALWQDHVHTRIERAEALRANGVITGAELNALRAELLQLEGQTIEISAARGAAVQSLSLLLAIDIPDDVVFIRPAHSAPPYHGEGIERPETAIFQYQRQLIAARGDLLVAANMPKLFLFATGGYGRPGLNFLNNDFTFYGLAGLGISWNISDGLNGKQNNDRQLLRIEQRQIDIRQETFELQTQILLGQLEQEMNKLEALREKDHELVTLRESIRQTAETQLDNGAITSSDYLLELNREIQARLQLTTRGLQWSLARERYRHVAGQ
jgi:outer membrane protein TolC